MELFSKALGYVSSFILAYISYHSYQAYKEFKDKKDNGGE